MSPQKKSRVPVKGSLNTSQISLEELQIDVSAFLHFLGENFEGEKNPDMASFWMLIPKGLDVEWREGVEGFFLEKEVFSRKIFIVAPPVSESKREHRKAELINMFSGILSTNQTDEIITLLSKILPDSRAAMIEKFRQYKASKDKVQIEET